jgi:3-mercaptopyruvate sulfurtransferase SseA
VFLKDMGFANVRVLVNGWTVWITAGLPTQKAGAANEQ